MKAASLTSTLLARKGTAAPSHLRAVDSPPPVNGPRLGIVAEGKSPVGVPCPAPGRRVKLSLRLDAGRHHRLRLAGAHSGRHLQDILVEAVDRYLDEIGPTMAAGGCSCFPSGGGRRSTE